MISRCAGQALWCCSRAGGEVGFQARGVRVVPRRPGAPQRLRVLDALARLEAGRARGRRLPFPPLRRGDHRVAGRMSDVRESTELPAGLRRAYVEALAPAALLAPIPL